MKTELEGEPGYTWTLALRSYKDDHGQYLATLQALGLWYLPQVPADPFSNGSLHFGGNSNGYTLYGVGPDGKDDGGKLACDAGNPGALSFIQTTSLGDVVARVNE